MRELKFRAWHTKQQKMYSAEEMAEDQLTLLPTGKFINVDSRNTKFSQIIEDMMPLQFTGLQDKNGVDIYEGDIVRCPNESMVAKICFGKYTIQGTWEEGFCDFHYYGFYLDLPNDQPDHFGTFDGTPNKFEIIGNIFEHPDLIN